MPHGGHHYTNQEVHACMFPLQGKEDSEALVGVEHDLVLRACSERREALYGGILK